jgi:7-keto-8-aminopelargonate synthetase-like enzyme
MHVSYQFSLIADFPIGTTALHNELEECVASFVRKPAALVFGMGYVTNSAILPVLMGKVGKIWWFFPC